MGSLISEVTAWIAAHATPVGASDGAPDAQEAKAIRQLIGAARVVALGEPAHGAHEPLAYRNRLIRFLVQHEGVTAVILESGLAQGRRLNDYVLGGVGDPVAIAREGLSWGFGALQANIDIMIWLRAFNAARPRRPVRLYGADASGGDDKDSFGYAGLAVDDVTAYLAEAAPARSADLRGRLAAFSGRFTPDAYRDYTVAERQALSRALADADDLVAALPPDLTSARAVEAHEWAVHEVRDCRYLEAIFQAWPKPGEDPLPALMALSEIRDRAMADHLLWLLGREGPGGRVFYFGHNGHVSAASRGVQRAYPTVTFPPAIGTHLRAVLGDDYRAVLTSSTGNSAQAPSDSRPPGTVDLAFAGVGAAPLLVDIRDAPKAGWWDTVQSIRVGFRGVSDIVPNQAADGFLVLGPLTAEPVTHPVINDFHSG